MVIDLVEEFAGSVARAATAEPYGRGQLLAVPWHIGHSEAVQIYVEQIEDDLFLLSDRGMAADSLGDFGVDLSKTGANRSWEATVRHGGLTPPALYTLLEFEIATTSQRADLGAAMTKLGETVLRTDGLRALSKRRAATFRERSMKAAAERGLAVISKPRIPTKYVHRQVSFGVEVDGEVNSFVETIGGRDGFEEIDRARVIFGDAEEVRLDKKVALIASAARTQGWQIDALNLVGRVVDESQQEGFFASLVS